MDRPYKAIVDSKECQKCHEGETWTVLCPDGDVIGQSFFEKIDALELANLLNNAYTLGKESMTNARRLHGTSRSSGPIGINGKRAKRS